MYYNEHTIIYHNGAFVKAIDAKTDFYSQSLHYGYAVFEGIRSYMTVSGETRIFKAFDHFERLKRSAEAINMPYHWSSAQLEEATYGVLEKNKIQDAYIRPVVYAPANMGFATNKESFIVIEAWKMEPFLGERLLKVMTSSFERPNPKGFKIEAKATGHYVNSILASQEAKAKGFDEALLNDMNGYIAEGPGANVFYIKNNKLVTPPAGNILPGITRHTVFEIAHELNIEVEETLFTTQDLKEADGAFFCGTAAEIIGWESIDNEKFRLHWTQTIGKDIQHAYQNKVREAMTKEHQYHVGEVKSLHTN